MPNDNKNNQNPPNHDNPNMIPLLSGINLQQSLSIPESNAGQFVAQPVDNQYGRLHNIRKIVSDMGGNSNARGSIPDVCAQEICVRSMLAHIQDGNNDESRANMKEQWYGTLFTYILSPLLFFARPDMQWQQVSLSDLNDSSNVFSTELKKSILPKKFPNTKPEAEETASSSTNRTWHFLTIISSAVTLPFLENGSLDFPVPSASLGQMPSLKNIVPWVNENQEQYENPLSALSWEALLYIDQWLDKHLHFDSKDTTPMMTAAYNTVRKDVQARLNELKQNDAFVDVKEHLLQALLMRDLVDTGIVIFQLDNMHSRESFAAAMANAPNDEAPMRNWEDITAAFPYGIMLHNQFVGFLDANKLFWLISPGYLQDSDAYRKMVKMLEKDLNKSDNLQYYRCKLAMLPTDHFQVSGALRKIFIDELTKNASIQKAILCPTPQKLALHEVALLNHPFEAMSRLCGYRHEDVGIFTPALQEYHGLKDVPFNSNDTYARWSEIRSSQVDGGQSTGNQAFLPLTIISATILRNGEMLEYTPSVILAENAEKDTITATFSISKSGICYQWSRDYTQHEIKGEKDFPLPAIGFWPDSAASEGDASWQGYYTYVSFGEAIESNTSSFALFNPDGDQISTSWASPNQLINPNNSLHFTWQTQLTKQRPSFCMVKRDGINIGCVLFKPPVLFKPYSGDAILAIDFGTTSTTGAVLKDPDDPKSIVVPMFDKSTIHWVLNKTTGLSWSLEQFIADRFNCKSSKTNITSFFTNVARFAAIDKNAPITSTSRMGDALYQDGHIYYYGDSFSSDNKMGNIRYFSLKLTDITNSDPLHHSNTSMFLQQTIETYMLYCRMDGLHVKEVRFAYPLALLGEQQTLIQDQMRKIVENAASKSGNSQCNVLFASESQAITAYFSQMPGYQRSLQAQGVVALDIGGGTSDFSYCRKNTKTTLCSCYSNRLAGHAILGDYIFESKKLTQNDKKGSELDWFYDGCDLIAKTKLEDEQKDIKAFKAALESAKTSAVSRGKTDEDYQFIFILEQFISLHPDLYIDIVRTAPFKDAYTLMMLDLTLLLWFGYLLGTVSLSGSSYTPAQTQETAQPKKKIGIHLGGNGAHMYRMLTKEDFKKINDLVPDCSDTDMEIHINYKRYRKREVAEGLLQDISLIKDDPSQIDTGSNLTPAIMWERFASLCERFTTIFSDHSDRITSSLNFIQSDHHKHIQEQFLEKVTNLDDLCHFMVDFHDIMLAHLFAQE